MAQTERERKIEALIDDWLDSIAAEGGSVVEHLLREGFPGYNNYSDADIDREYEGAFGDSTEDET